jgi:hypothetical protein
MLSHLEHTTPTGGRGCRGRGMRAAAETAAMAVKTARLAMVELVAARVEVEAAAVMDVAHAAAAELKDLCGSSTRSSVSADGGTDDELKLARETTREQAVQWAAVHPRGAVAVAQMSTNTSVVLRVGARMAAVLPTATAAQTGANTPVAGSMEIAGFTGGVALPPRIGTMVTMGSRPLSEMLVPVVGGLPSPRSTTSNEPR